MEVIYNMKEIEINVLTDLTDEECEKFVDKIDTVIYELLHTEDIMIFTKDYEGDNG